MPSAAGSQRRKTKNIDSAKVNRMVNSATRYSKVIAVHVAQAVQAAATPKTQRALSRALAGATQNSYFLY
jgi:hypothetical protein